MRAKRAWAIGTIKRLVWDSALNRRDEDSPDFDEFEADIATSLDAAWDETDATDIDDEQAEDQHTH